MDTSTLDFNTLTLLVTLLVAIMGSTLMIVTLMFRQFNRHGDSIKSLSTNVAVLDTQVAVLNTKVDALDTQVAVLDTKVTALDTKVTSLAGKADTMGRDVSDSRERLARVEGHLLAPQGFTLHHPGQRDAGEPPSGDPAPDHREAG